MFDSKRASADTTTYQSNGLTYHHDDQVNPSYQLSNGSGEQYFNFLPKRKLMRPHMLYQSNIIGQRTNATFHSGQVDAIDGPLIVQSYEAQKNTNLTAEPKSIVYSGNNSLNRSQQFDSIIQQGKQIMSTRNSQTQILFNVVQNGRKRSNSPGKDPKFGNTQPNLPVLGQKIGVSQISQAFLLASIGSSTERTERTTVVKSLDRQSLHSGAFDIQQQNKNVLFDALSPSSHYQITQAIQKPRASLISMDSEMLVEPGNMKIQVEIKQHYTNKLTLFAQRRRALDYNTESNSQSPLIQKQTNGATISHAPTPTNMMSLIGTTSSTPQISNNHHSQARLNRQLSSKSVLSGSQYNHSNDGSEVTPKQMHLLPRPQSRARLIPTNPHQVRLPFIQDLLRKSQHNPTAKQRLSLFFQTKKSSMDVSKTKKDSAPLKVDEEPPFAEEHEVLL
ncbi:hypothetical protein FGO68_gene16456 [Halteria grandinella]|uniref:Uncharacterized protein n=1 Tax=Halteria grandinella TaxID=5974 RepID=A0A8J8NTG5_HALGN|nr:hypothetical protein FGO68_gene16456 [Halteria grandinella]